MEKDGVRLDGTGYLEVLNKFLIPTAYLGPISYYAILLQKANCIIEKHEYFVKQSIRNRCNIYGANGKLRLTIPKIREKSNNTIINNIKISNEENWQKIHWNAIESAYNSSPFFIYYKDELRDIYNNKEIFLMDFNNKIQDVILNFLKVDKEQMYSNEYNNTGDFKDLRSYKFDINNIPRYDQVFMEKHGFIDNLSILDLLFNLGPESLDYLYSIETNI